MTLTTWQLLHSKLLETVSFGHNILGYRKASVDITALPLSYKFSDFTTFEFFSGPEYLGYHTTMTMPHCQYFPRGTAPLCTARSNRNLPESKQYKWKILSNSNEHSQK